MPLLDRMLSRLGLERKQAVPITSSVPTISVYPSYSGGAWYSGWSYGTYAKQGYAANSDVYACVSLIASAAKQIRWDVAKSNASLKLLESAPGGAVGFLES